MRDVRGWTSSPASSKALYKGSVYSGAALGSLMSKNNPLSEPPNVITSWMREAQPALLKTASKSAAYCCDSGLFDAQIITIFPLGSTSKRRFNVADCSGVKRRSRVFCWRSASAFSVSAAFAAFTVSSMPFNWSSLLLTSQIPTAATAVIRPLAITTISKTVLNLDRDSIDDHI